jgi:hypothetical protein
MPRSALLQVPNVPSIICISAVEKLNKMVTIKNLTIDIDGSNEASIDFRHYSPKV